MGRAGDPRRPIQHRVAVATFKSQPLKRGSIKTLGALMPPCTPLIKGSRGGAGDAGTPRKPDPRTTPSRPQWHAARFLLADKSPPPPTCCPVSFAHPSPRLQGRDYREAERPGGERQPRKRQDPSALILFPALFSGDHTGRCSGFTRDCTRGSRLARLGLGVRLWIVGD